MNITEPQLIGFISGLSLFISIVVTAFGKYAMPVIYKWFMGEKDIQSASIDKILKIESNHIPHLEADIKEIKEELVRQGNRLTRLETLIEK